MHSKSEPRSLPRVMERLANDNNFTKLALTSITVNPEPDPHNTGRFIYHYYDNDLLLLAKALERNNSLKEFAVIDRGNSAQLAWTAVGAVAIGKALKNIPSLETVTINLKSSSLNGPEVIGFLECLAGNSRIKNLNFYFYCDDIDSMNYLGSLLMSNKSLESIYLQGKGGSVTLVPPVLIDGLMEAKTLQSLSMQDIHLGDQGIQQLSSLLNQHSLKTLTLNQCGVTGEAMKYLLPSLATHCDGIEVLDLSYNNLNHEGMQCLVNELPLLKNLKELLLRSTGFNPQALACLAIGLRKANCCIKELNLDNNHFEVTDMASIKTIIKNNTTLMFLSMNFCNLGDRHVVALNDLLSNPEQCYLHGFEFTGNLTLAPKTQQMILDSVRRNLNLCYFSTPGESIPLLKEATEINRRKKIRQSQALFINACIELANIYYRADSNELSVFSAVNFFPMELILKIILEVGNDTFGMNETSLQECAKLIFENFNLRRHLINQGQYRPEMHADNPFYPISSWWKTATTIHGTSRTLFTSVKSIEHSKENIEEEQGFCRVM
ncbi:Ran GTPase-activating protein (RanGAP) involved in mRNA processing and transport [Legionella beliardensis]|uniref:Ran GTPase-activating protein (RanGAP) involved in mRNA processing and transport n=1 Tax=Legionella beliardensis TaxID=91822 RepID=A0A378HZC4_9GAMM|nr:hypothetical protein [Legionella beliardensis]STX27861.1 Ran GTPase-activating protein (RanGAP) involved in mRNA processing and transport [Legionella beliardensis]